MGYPGHSDRDLVHPTMSDLKDPTTKIAALYHVSSRIFADGHVCTALVRLDMGQRRTISSNLGCYQTVVASESAALQCIIDAASVRLAALSAGVEYPPE